MTSHSNFVFLNTKIIMCGPAGFGSVSEAAGYDTNEHVQNEETNK